MKLKILFGLTFSCLLICLGMTVSNTLTAQSRSPMVSGWPFSVNFIEDPFRMHGLKAKSFYASLIPKTPALITKVPGSMRYIITDITAQAGGNIVLWGGPNKVATHLSSATPHISFRTGIVFDQNEEINVEYDTKSPITISGYYVDL